MIFFHLSIPNHLSFSPPCSLPVWLILCSLPGLLWVIKGEIYEHIETETPQSFTSEIWGRGEEIKKRTAGHNALSSACLTTKLCLFLEAEHWINHWERLFQLTWETSGFWCWYIAPLLGSVGQRLVTVSTKWYFLNCGKLSDPEKRHIANYKLILVQWCNTMLCSTHNRTAFRSYFNQLRTVGPFST